MASRVGRVDPIRTAGGGPGASNISAEIRDIRSASPSQGTFLRVIVHEVLGDLSRRTQEEIETLGEEVPGGPLSILKAPRNSILAIPVTGPGTEANTQKLLCYPFFPPHLSMPVKPGEQVWAIQEVQSPDQVGFWMCRVSESNFLDDINFTHADRKFSVYVDKVTTDSSSNAAGDGSGEESRPFDGLKDPDKTPGPPDFSFGPTADTDAITPSITDPLRENPEQTSNPYDVIYTGSFSLQSFVFEPVPRFTKRPGDLVFQGSNNTLICLGQDRGWTASERPDTATHSNAFVDVGTGGSATEPLPDFCGTIDIVSGRGRFFTQTPPNPDTAQIKDTQPRVIQNTRSKLETDKNPASYINDPHRSSIESNRLDRPQEGDPDFLTDASRIYVSMRTNGDANFNVTSDIVYPAFEGDITNVENSPFVIVKSDEVRIIARKETERDTINGGIRLIKEGALNDDLAVIYMMPSGIIQISGNKIYMGQPDQGNGPGEKKSEPYVKYSELEALLTKWFDNINDFCQKVLTHTTPGYGAPSIQLNQAVTTLQTEASTRKSEIEKLKSTRIFGE